METQTKAKTGPLKAIGEKMMIMKVPSYGNSIFYSLGFLGITCFAILLASGLVMVFMGPAWWLANPAGIFFRSIHLWTAQAFVLIIILHALVVFSTSAFKPPRRLTWILGSIMFFLMLLEAEFGFYLRGDFSSQYRALQGADFWNGAFLGNIINTLNNAEIYGIHIVLIPAVIFALLILHYMLVKIRGIAAPYKKDFKYKTVAANHKRLFLRGAALAALIIILAVVFPSPLVTPVNIQKIAGENPELMAKTLESEYNRDSDTATYFDSIDPYKFDTRQIYVLRPYETYEQNIGNAASGAHLPPVPQIISTLVGTAKSGLYESMLNNFNPGINPTYALRFLSDTGVMDDEAASLHITTEQWGMMREESGKIPPGAWWLAPLGILDHTILANDNNGDRDGAIILALIMMLFIFLPYIPYANRIPEKLHLAEFIWKM